MEQSKYGNYRRRRLKRHRKSALQEGSFEDRDTWYKCWNCGYVFDLNKVGGNPEQDGTYRTDAIIYSDDPEPQDRIINIRTMTNTHVLMELDGGGNPKPIVSVFKHNAGSGCSFCGTSNIP